MNFISTFDELNKLYEDMPAWAEHDISVQKSKGSNQWFLASFKDKDEYIRAIVIAPTVEEAEKRFNFYYPNATEVYLQEDPIDQKTVSDLHAKGALVLESLEEAEEATEDKINDSPKKSGNSIAEGGNNVRGYEVIPDINIGEPLGDKKCLKTEVTENGKTVFGIAIASDMEGAYRLVKAQHPKATKIGIHYDKPLTPDDAKCFIANHKARLYTYDVEALLDVEQYLEEDVDSEVAIDTDEPQQVICECDKCGALVIKDEADIVANEETDLVNVEDECQFCEEAKGFKIIGVVAPYEAAEEAALEEGIFDGKKKKSAEFKNAARDFDYEVEKLSKGKSLEDIARDMAGYVLSVPRDVYFSDKKAANKQQVNYTSKVDSNAALAKSVKLSYEKMIKDFSKPTSFYRVVSVMNDCLSEYVGGDISKSEALRKFNRTYVDSQLIIDIDQIEADKLVKKEALKRFHNILVRELKFDYDRIKTKNHADEIFI